MAANENWTAMSTLPSLDREKRNRVEETPREDRLRSSFRDSSMIKAAHQSVNSHEDI